MTEGYLLCLDVGNTETGLGLFQEQKLWRHWRLSSRLARTPDEWGLTLLTLLQRESPGTPPLGGVAIASVVPPLTETLSEVCHRYLQQAPVILSSELDLGITLEVENPRQVGADRIANTLAVYHHYRRDAVVVDLGTATTIDVISKDGHFLGGVITPGIRASAETLFEKTAMLPLVESRIPPRVIGTNTESCIQSGLCYGHACLVDGLVARIKDEWRRDLLVLATGGMAQLIAPLSSTIERVDEYLTLKGVELVYRRVGGGGMKRARKGRA